MYYRYSLYYFFDLIVLLNLRLNFCIAGFMLSLLSTFVVSVQATCFDRSTSDDKTPPLNVDLPLIAAETENMKFLKYKINNLINI